MSPKDKEALTVAIRDALSIVIDPELGESLVELGLIYEIAVSDDGSARIAMTTTTPGCPATVFLQEAVQSAAREVEGVRDIEVQLTYEPPWTPLMASEAARQRFGGGGAVRRASHAGR